MIACIGETLAQRESGKMFDVLTKQLVAIGDNIAGETTEGAFLGAAAPAPGSWPGHRGAWAVFDIHTFWQAPSEGTGRGKLSAADPLLSTCMCGHKECRLGVTAPLSVPAWRGPAVWRVKCGS